MTREIQLTRGYVALVDEADYGRASGFKWCAALKLRTDGSLRAIYGRRSLRLDNGKQTTELLHRFILNLSDPRVQVDHIDGNGLDNRRGNLRKCTNAQNGANSRTRRDSKSGFKGVSWNKGDKKWRAYIGICGKRTCLGRYETKESAAEAYVAAAKKYFGKFANPSRSASSEVSR